MDLEVAVGSKTAEAMREIFKEVDKRVGEPSCPEDEKREYQPDLEEVFKNDPTGRLRLFWEQQREAIRRHENGELSGIRWNSITIRVALSVYLRSAAGYHALSESGVLRLPSKVC